MKRLLACLTLILLINGCASGPSDQSREGPPEGTRGMVSSAHPLATEAGLEVLRNGGNAFDAALAVATTLNVVEPMMSGIGGYGTILVYSAGENRARFLNPSGRMPSGLDSDQFRPPTPNYMRNRRGAKAVSTPGNVNAWQAMWEVYGTMEWDELFDRAIEHAENGFRVDPRTARFIAEAYPEFPDYAKSIYGVDGEALSAGDTLVQADLGRSLGMIASRGAEAFHGGPLGEAVDEIMRETDGFLRLQDLRDNQAEWWEPISINYRGYRVVAASPPANSWPALLRLGIMEQFDPAAVSHNSVVYLHRYAEATKHAYWTRLRWAGDPEVNPPPLERLLSDSYWAEQADRISPDSARPFIPPDPAASGGEMHTTHFVVADSRGNVVSATQTLGNLFGAKIMPEGTGIWLNNSLQYSTFEPKGNPMDAFPGRHKLSGDVPLFVMREGRPWIAVGTPGGHTIAQNVPQIVMNMIDFGMNIREAIASPKISFLEPDFLGVERTFPEHIIEGLKARGHNVRLLEGIGNAHGLTIRYDSTGTPSLFQGSADPRGIGSAGGY